MTQRFNADTAALGEREVLNQAAARIDLEAWIIGHLHPSAGQRVLDLGCGRGKQVFALAPLVLPGGAILGIDVSADAVAEVNHRAAAEGWRHVSAVEMGLDDCLGKLGGRTFDRILSTYAIYYARDMVGLLCGLRAHLAPGGQAFHCGFGGGSNQEIMDIINRAAQEFDLRAGACPKRPAAGAEAAAGSDSQVAGAEAIDDFITPAQIEQLREAYAGVQVVRLANHIDFPAADAVMRWWRNHNSHRSELDGPVHRAVAAVVSERGSFSLSKNVIGIHLHA